MLDIAFVLIVITALLVVVGLCQPLAAYLKLPPPVLLGVVGLALGGFPALVAHLGWSRGTDAFSEVFVDLPVSSGIFIYVFLPLLVFEAGIATDVRRMLEDAAPILLLAIVATLISTAVVGLALWPFGRSRWWSACCSALWCRPPIPRRSSRSFATSAHRRADPPGRGRGSAQRCRRDRAIRRLARNDRNRS